MTAPTPPPPPPEHEKYVDWDGAYVLGALPPAERTEFEAHLAGCELCARAVAELASLPGLLGRVGDPERDALLRGEPVPALATEPPADLEHRIRLAAQTKAHGLVRRRRRRVALALAAAAVVAVGVAVPVIRHQSEPAAAGIVLQASRPSPLSADVTLTPTDWGTRVAMTCVYSTGASGWTGSRSYGLWVIDRSGRAHLVSTWHAAPGQTARTTGSTDLGVSQVSSVELRAADGSTVLLSAAL